jgi:hypothetical protein
MDINTIQTVIHTEQKSKAGTQNLMSPLLLLLLGSRRHCGGGSSFFHLGDHVFHVHRSQRGERSLEVEQLDSAAALDGDYKSSPARLLCIDLRLYARLSQHLRDGIGFGLEHGSLLAVFNGDLRGIDWAGCG